MTLLKSRAILLTLVVLLQATALVLASPIITQYRIGIPREGRWIRAAPSANPWGARIKADDLHPKGLSYSWELVPSERGDRAFEIKNIATHLSIVGYDMEDVELTAASGKGSTWIIEQYYGSKFAIRLADTRLYWTYDEGLVRLKPYQNDVLGQIWTFVADHPDHPDHPDHDLPPQHPHDRHHFDDFDL